MRVFLIALIVVALLATATHAANGMRLTIADEKLFLAAAATNECKVDAALVINYQLKKAKNAYVSSNTANLQGSTCGATLQKVQTGTGLKPVIKFEALTAANLDLECETKCGSIKCLCEVGMTCVPPTPEIPASPCEAIADCQTNTCVAKKVTLTSIIYSFPLIGSDQVERDRFQRAFRDAISKFGVDSHCWIEKYVYDTPLTKEKDKWEITVMNNDANKRGCNSVQFAFPPNLIPKTTAAVNPDFVTVALSKDTHEISMECLDQATKLLTCSAACYAPCPAYSICTTNDDCQFGACKTQKDADGKDMTDKRCANATITSTVIAVTLALVALFF